MATPICLRIPAGATLTRVDPFGGAPPEECDAREWMHYAVRSARSKLIERGTDGTRFDVQIRDDDAAMLWKLAGGSELEAAFGV